MLNLTQSYFITKEISALNSQNELLINCVTKQNCLIAWRLKGDQNNNHFTIFLFMSLRHFILNLKFRLIKIAT